MTWKKKYHRMGQVRSGVLVVPPRAGHPPGVSEAMLYFATEGGYVVKARTSDGRAVWSPASGNTQPAFRNSNPFPPMRSTPVVQDGVVYVADGKVLHAIHDHDGRRKWTASVHGGGRLPDSMAPLVCRGRVYAGNEDGDVVAMHAANGTEIWSVQGPADARSTSAAVIIGTTLFVGASSNKQAAGHLHAIATIPGRSCGGHLVHVPRSGTAPPATTGPGLGSPAVSSTPAHGSPATRPLEKESTAAGVLLTVSSSVGGVVASAAPMQQTTGPDEGGNSSTAPRATPAATSPLPACPLQCINGGRCVLGKASGRCNDPTAPYVTPVCDCGSATAGSCFFGRLCERKVACPTGMPTNAVPACTTFVPTSRAERVNASEVCVIAGHGAPDNTGTTSDAGTLVPALGGCAVVPPEPEPGADPDGDAGDLELAEHLGGASKESAGSRSTSAPDVGSKVDGESRGDGEGDGGADPWAIGGIVAALALCAIIAVAVAFVAKQCKDDRASTSAGRAAAVSSNFVTNGTFGASQAGEHAHAHAGADDYLDPKFGGQAASADYGVIADGPPAPATRAMDNAAYDAAAATTATVVAANADYLAPTAAASQNPNQPGHTYDTAASGASGADHLASDADPRTRAVTNAAYDVGSAPSAAVGDAGAACDAIAVSTGMAGSEVREQARCDSASGPAVPSGPGGADYSTATPGVYTSNDFC